MEPHVEYRYGWFRFTPSFLQRLNRPQVVLLCLFWGFLFQTIITLGLPGTTISTVERQFGYTSQQSSWIINAFNVAAIPALILVTCFGNGIHRPRWISIGFATISLSSIIYALPYFLADSYSLYKENEPQMVADYDNLCNSSHVNQTCARRESGNQGSTVMWLFILARVLVGFGSTPLNTIAITYLSDVCTKEQFASYIGIFYSGGVLGMLFSFVICGYILSIPTVSTEGLTPDDPRWVGTWWPGFIAFGIAILLFALPMSAFPKDLPGARDIRARKKSEAYNEKLCTSSDLDKIAKMVENKKKHIVMETLHSFRAIFTNPTYIFLTLFRCCDQFMLAGFGSYGSKYNEIAFSVSAAAGAMAFGGTAASGGLVGTILGGLLTKKLNLKCLGIIKCQIVFTLIMICSLTAFLLNCDQVKFAGVQYY